MPSAWVVAPPLRGTFPCFLMFPPSMKYLIGGYRSTWKVLCLPCTLPFPYCARDCAQLLSTNLHLATQNSQLATRRSQLHLRSLPWLSGALTHLPWPKSLPVCLPKHSGLVFRSHSPPPARPSSLEFQPPMRREQEWTEALPRSGQTLLTDRSHIEHGLETMDGKPA